MTMDVDGIQPDPSDRELVEAAQRGSAHAFQLLVERHFRAVHAVGFARLGHRETAEDLAQEVFVRAHLGLSKLTDPARFAAWVCRIAQNLATDWRRAGRTTSNLLTMMPLEEVAERVADDKSAKADDAVGRGQEKEALQEAIFRLPQEQREIVLLHYMDDLSQKEIADRLAVHPATVNRQLKKALAALRATLEPVLREAAPDLRPSKAALARTIAATAAVATLSSTSKSALAVAAGGLAQSAASSLPASSTSSGIPSLLSTIGAAIGAGGKVMVGAKVGGGLVAAALVACGCFYLANGHDKGAKTMTQETKANVVQQQTGEIGGIRRTFFAKLSALHKQGRDAEGEGKLYTSSDIYMIRGSQLVLFALGTIHNTSDKPIEQISAKTISKTMRSWDEDGTPREVIVTDTMAQFGINSFTERFRKPIMPGEERTGFTEIPGFTKDLTPGTTHDIVMETSENQTMVKQYFLVLPPNVQLVRSSEEPALREKQDDSTILVWRKRIPGGYYGITATVMIGR